MTYPKILFLIPVFLLAIGCSEKERNTNQEDITEPSVSQDSVIFTVNSSNFEANFYKISSSGKGSATGPTLFQRYGSLSYILDELYAQNPVKVLDNPHPRQNFKIEINWEKNSDFESARDSVWLRLQSYFKYNIRRDSIKQEQYDLSVIDDQKLDKAAAGPSNEKIEFKSEINNGQWEVLATLPRFAEALSKQTNKPVDLKDNQESGFYRYELDLNNGIADLRSQLRDKYGLLMTVNQVPVERLTIDFRDN